MESRVSTISDTNTVSVATLRHELKLSTNGVALQLRGLSKSFDDKAVLQRIDLDVAPGSFVGVVGRSGCGKSTLLRLVAGLETATTGEIRIDDAPLVGLNRIARVMFQDARLLPWRRVRENVTLGLSADGATRAETLLARVGLADRAKDWPAILSGGQRQRVALARALASQPRLLLLDEPLGALDALTRLDMQELVESIWQETAVTALLVTHDVEEAVALCDRVLVIKNGGIALDVPVDLSRPRCRSCQEFIALREQILSCLLKRPQE